MQRVSSLSAVHMLAVTTLVHVVWMIAQIHVVQSLASSPIESLLLQSLSPIESLLLRSRLSTIQDSLLFELLRCDKNENMKKIPARGSDVVLIFPGAGGADSLTNELEDTMNKMDVKVGIKPSTRWIHIMDWKEYRGSIVTAAYDGEAVGEVMAAYIARFRPRSVHCIGISVGAFCANAMATYLIQNRDQLLSKYPHHDSADTNDDNLSVRLTLLDPFCSRGLAGIGYGAKYFGDIATDNNNMVDYDSYYAEQYLNTDDPVPTTNDPLPNCYCIDVTGSKERDSFVLPPGESMHCWPLAYFARHGYQSEADTNGRIVLHSHDETCARGTVV